MSAHLHFAEPVPPVVLVPVAEGALAIATLASVLLCIVAYGLHEGWEHTIGWGLRWVADKVRGAISIPTGFWGHIDPLAPLADAFEWIDKSISHALAVVYLDSEKAVVWLWHMMGVVFWWSVHETKALSLDVYHALHHLVSVTVPDAAKWAHREAVKVARSLVHEEAAIRRAADREIRHLAHVAEADALEGVRKAEHALDWSEHEAGVLERDLRGLRAKVEQIARQLSPAAIVALIGATIFNDLGLGWLRCGNVTRMGRALCGMPVHLLEDLLGLLADFLILTNICSVIPLLEEGFATVAGPLISTLSSAGAGLCSPKAKQPPTLAVADLSLPPVGGILTDAG